LRKALFVLTAFIIVTTSAFAQGFGTVSGVVYDSGGTPLEGAFIHLTEDGWHGGGGHGHHHHGENYFGETGVDGTFFIDDVASGDYYAVASKMGYGHDSEDLEVTAGQNTYVEFHLEMGGHGGGMHGDSLEIVELSGWAILEIDSFATHYYLDTENDGIPDYRLLFGPPWYDPGSGAQRPADGDSIWVVAGVMGYSQPQPVVVYEINGLFWREPGSGHGGHGGYGGNCPHPDSLDLVEVSGLAMIVNMPHMDMYFLDEDYDQVEDYHINFGAPWYDPGNGATRPEDGDTIVIVGGLMEDCMNWPMIIVYEINGQFWRQPGDTTWLWANPTSIGNEGFSQIPEDHIVARSYPNPFNPSATISFELPVTQHVKITVYDILGREIAILMNGVAPAGTNEVQFELRQYNTPGSSVYFYKIEGSKGSISGKMILLK
jgi:hypothetical protein